MNEIIPMEIINQKIFLIRREKVMFDVDLAKLYGVETKQTNITIRIIFFMLSPFAIVKVLDQS